MSIRERLQGLVELLETKEQPEDELVDEIEKIEELLSSEEEAEEVSETQDSPDQVEVPWEELEAFRACQTEISKMQMLLGRLLVNYELQKEILTKKAVEAQESMQKEVERIREEKGIAKEKKYSFTIPEKVGESGFFKKEE